MMTSTNPVRARSAVHRTILVADVTAFGDHSRTDPNQIAIRDGLYDAMMRAFERVGISWSECDREDRGDGILLLIPPTVPKSLLVEPLLTELVVALRAYNQAHKETERFRLRIALHAGEIYYDDHSVVGRAINPAVKRHCCCIGKSIT